MGIDTPIDEECEMCGGTEGVTFGPELSQWDVFDFNNDPPPWLCGKCHEEENRRPA